jgi:hypothetical protein
MPMSVASKQQNNNIKEEVVSGFLGGLNTFQDETLIKESELSEAKNILLDVDGIQPRPGSENYESSTDSTVLGGLGYYKSNGTREFLRVSGGKLKKYVSGTPTTIGTATYSTTADACLVQARDNVYIFNGSDELSYYNGSTITVYTALTTPAKPTVTRVGATTGKKAYSYRVSAFNNVGETLASTATAITNGTATITASNYNRITWSAVTNATGYNLWGREATGLGETYLKTVYTTGYNDNEGIDSSVTLIPPEGNTTQGIKCTMAIFAISRIFAAGDPNHPSRLYYGGVGTNIGNFSGSTEGGGYVDVFRNDGAQIRAIAPFQGGVIVGKDNGIYKFTFTTVTIGGDTVSVPQLEEITRSFGMISFRGIQAVENDLVFPAKKDGRLAFYSLGNQENYAGSVLRTNELSIKVSERLRDVNLSRLPNSAAYYFNNLYGCAVSKSGSSANDRIWLLDTRFGAWVYWEGLSPRFFMTYEDANGNSALYYGNESNGYMTEMFKTARNDNGAAIDVQFSTKAFNQKLFHKIKKYYHPTFQFKEVNQSGALQGEVYLDGAILDAGFTINQQTSGGAGVGVSLPGFTLPGEADGGQESGMGISSDIVTEVFSTNRGRSIKYNFKSESTDFFYKFLSLAHLYAVLGKRRLNSDYRTYPTS